MSKISKTIAAMSALPVMAFASSAYAAGNPGQIEQGDIYRAKDVTTNSAFADNINAICGDTVAYRVRIHNGGPATLTNVKVSATLDQSASTTSHGSKVSVSADNNLDNIVVTANSGVASDKATIATYIGGSTQLLNYSSTPGGENVIANLPDGILGSGINIGSVGPFTSDTEEVQFEAKLNCPTPTPPPAPVYTCDELGVAAENNRTVKIASFTTSATNGATFKNAVIDWGDKSSVFTTSSAVGQTHVYSADGTYTVVVTAHFNVNGQDETAGGVNCAKQVTFKTNTPPVVTPPKVTPPTVTPPSVTPPAPSQPAPTELVNTGAGNVAGIFAATTAAGALAYRKFASRRLSRQ